ncbi:hypothetical protein HPO96_28615 [Kribbella sandramycini]|uniref:Uncharacterized protein n=1 Tax=Kribbella sandramycini TaxID=60450 RepID=A0A7Y4L6A5_9ACTN|nr:hypothetical protein [Kribbella sandramycini]MBB6571571.1 hypothetical protein [Kribbella sandramycini]NOL44217.1 hypothetical protein [Kribbella sandramycini]
MTQHTYVRTDGIVSARELTLNYVTICAQIEATDRLLSRLTGALQNINRGDGLTINIVKDVLESNNLAWNRRAELVEARTTAYTALVEGCAGNQSTVDQYVSTVAKEFGFELELTN